MRTLLNLQQIRSMDFGSDSDSEENVTLSENIKNINDKILKKVVPSYTELELCKDVGFYLVDKDENNNGFTTYYYYDGEKYLKLSQNGSKKSVLFYFKKITKLDQSIEIYIPYKGVIKELIIKSPELIDLESDPIVVELQNGSSTIETLTLSNGGFIKQTSDMVIDNEAVKVTYKGGPIGLVDLNVIAELYID